MRSHTRVVEAIDAGRHEVEEEAELRIREIEAERDLELSRLERAKLALLGSSGRSEEDAAGKGDAPPAPRRRRRNRKRASTSSKSVAERRESVFRFISESADPVASGQLTRGLDMSSHAVHTALRQLLKERRIVRLGNSASTRYAVRSGLSTGVAKRSQARGTMQGRVQATVEDRGYATAEELGQALGEPVERVLEACAALQAEEEIRMDRREGKPVYVSAPAA